MSLPSPVLRLYLAAFAYTTTEALVAIVVPTYLDAAGLAVQMVGTLVSVFSASALLSRLPTGLLYRRHRARLLLGVALALMASGALLYPLSTEVWLLAAARLVGGFGFGVASTVSLAAMMEAMPSGPGRHRALAVYTTVIVMGFAVGRAVGGPVADLFGYGATFILAAGVGLAGVLCAPRLGAGATSTGPLLAKERPARESAGPRWRHRLAALAHPGMLGVGLTAFMLNYLLTTSIAFVPLYALSVGLSLTEISGIMAAHSFSQIIARPLSGEAARRWGHRRLINATVILLVVAYMLIPFCRAFLPLAALFLVVGMLRAAGVVGNTIQLAEDVPQERLGRGAAASLYNAMKDIGDVSGPLLSGFIAGQIGLANLFLFVPPVLLALYGLAIVGVRRLRGRASLVVM